MVARKQKGKNTWTYRLYPLSPFILSGPSNYQGLAITTEAFSTEFSLRILHRHKKGWRDKSSMYMSIQYDWQLRLAMCWELTILVTVAVKRHHDQTKATLIK